MCCMTYVLWHVITTAPPLPRSHAPTLSHSHTHALTLSCHLAHVLTHLRRLTLPRSHAPTLPRFNALALSRVSTSTGCSQLWSRRPRSALFSCLLRPGTITSPPSTSGKPICRASWTPTCRCTCARLRMCSPSTSMGLPGLLVRTILGHSYFCQLPTIVASIPRPPSQLLVTAL